MGLAHSPRIATNGLVFAFDTDNIKSYKGPAIQNMATSITATGGTITGESWVTGSETVNIPTVGTLTAQTITGYNNYSVSGDCCPTLFYYGVPVYCQPSTLYTYSLLYKSTLGYSHPNFMYRYEWTSGNAYITEGGVHNNSNRIHLGDGWYWAWGTFTTTATASHLHVRLFHYNYTTAIEKLYVAKVLVTPGNFTGLHPSRWPDVNTTRANTATVYDISGQNLQMTANSLTYASNGSFSFNGISNYINLGNVLNVGQTTITVAFKLNSLATRPHIIGKGGGASGWAYLVVETNGTLNCFYDLSSSWSSLSGGTLSANTWYIVTFTYDGSSPKVYVNGNLTNSATNAGSLKTSDTNNFYIGTGPGVSQFVDGLISFSLIYNRALSDSEVKQNYNALKGRFGI